MNIFPISNPNQVNESDWGKKILDWFTEDYNSEPEQTLSTLLDHVFEILRKFGSATPPKELGKKLKEYLLENPPQPECLHHIEIFELMELGLNENVSHFFMFPRIQKENLVSIPNYSKVLLAARLLSASDIKRAKDIASQVGIVPNRCCIAAYIIAQAARLKNLLHESNSAFKEAEIILKNFKEMPVCCAALKENQPLCNADLLEAEILRGRAVVFRNLKQYEESEKFFGQAINAAEKAAEKTAEKLSQKSTGAHFSNDVIKADYIFNPDRVISDVYFSYGYFNYSQKKYPEAKKSFCSSINALEKTNEKWDAPYLRLAIVEFCLDNWSESRNLFIETKIICEYTNNNQNRQSVLGRALSLLGLKIIEIIEFSDKNEDGRLIESKINILDELEQALIIEPRLSEGPLKCHQNDANHLLEKLQSLKENINLRSAIDLVEEFIERLKNAIEELKKIEVINENIPNEIPVISNDENQNIINNYYGDYVQGNKTNQNRTHNISGEINANGAGSFTSGDNRGEMANNINQISSSP